MPYRDPEAGRANARRRYAANKVAINEAARRAYAADPEKKLAASRRSKAAHPASRRLQQLSSTHHVKDFSAMFHAMWVEQDGYCYLCDRPLVPGRDTVIDHDHSCCPAQRSCEVCRRGLAHRECNFLVGHADDDPERLEIIAYNLAFAVDATRARIAAKPEQLTMDWLKSSHGHNVAGSVTPAEDHCRAVAPRRDRHGKPRCLRPSLHQPPGASCRRAAFCCPAGAASHGGAR